MAYAKKIVDFDKAVAQLTVDKLGDARARLKLVKDEIADCEDYLKHYSDKHGDDAVDGSHYRAAIVSTSRKTTAWQKIARDLGASARRIAANTKESFYAQVRVSALKK